MSRKGKPMLGRRYPRVEDAKKRKLLRLINKLRTKYPLPAYDWHRDGSFNPGLAVLSNLIEKTKEQLRVLCDKHALDTIGSRFKLIKRMYLHWRASKLQLGDPQVGYGKGYESTRTPSCVCGFLRREFLDAKANRVKLRLERMRQLKEMYKLGRKYPRYHRYPRGVK